MLVEIPRGSRAKLEISRDEPLNPIKQDMKNGKLRYTHWPYPFNYGAFPQTWENPTHKDSNTEAFGDNDPVDVVEIGKKVHKTGDVIQVKILGAYAMIDEGQTDWKVLAIDITDEDASKYNSGTDVHEVKKKEVFEFLRDYKIPDGKPPNKFAFNSELKDKQFALDIVEETYLHWKKLITLQIPATTDKYKITTVATELPPEECPSVVPKEKAAEMLEEKLKASRRLNKQILSARVSNWKGLYWCDSDDEEEGGGTSSTAGETNGSATTEQKKKTRREDDDHHLEQIQ